MDLNCKSVIERYFLNNNPLYAFSLPLSILIAIITFGFAKAYNWSDNSYINQILIPILSLVLSLVVIDIIARLMLPQKEMSELINKCKLWTNNQNIKEKFTPKRILQEEEEFEKLKENYKQKYRKGEDSEENSTQKYRKGEDSEENSTQKYRKEKDSKKYRKGEDSEENSTQKYRKIKESYENYREGDSEEYYLSKINNIKNETVENPIETIGNLSPFPLESIKYNSKCIEDSNCCSLCSGTNINPCNIVAPIPGPNWLPQNAESVQSRLVNNDYTSSKCPL